MTAALAFGIALWAFVGIFNPRLAFFALCAVMFWAWLVLLVTK